MFEGMMEFDSDGTFQGFLGSNRVQFDLIDYFWKQIATEEQREGQVLFIPEEFNNLDVDDFGFIYTVTSQEEAEEPVKRQNAEGRDVLRREGFFDPQGDVVYPQFGSISGPSLLIDIAVEANGTYSVLDAKRGRVFTYDEEGHLLFAFGGLGNQIGSFRDPIALDYLQGRLLVLDRTFGNVTSFTPTEFGRYVREAVYRYNQGDYDMSFALWNRVLQMNANYELGYTGIGKILYRRSAYEDALSYFRLGNNRRYYSRSYEEVRQDFLRDNFSVIMTTLVVLVVVLIFWNRQRQKNKEYVPMKLMPANPRFWERVNYGLYVIGHPFDGYYDLKHANIGSAGSATAVLGLFVITMLIHTQLTAFLFNFRDINEINMGQEVISILLPFFVFALANWTLTTLMDGEGSIRNIYIATAYATIPIVLIYLPLTVMSHVLTLQEGAFFYFFRTFAAVWVGWLLFTGNMVTQGYNVKKTIFTLLLTVVAMGIIIFLGLLFFTLLEQVWSFVETIYQEIVFRI
jgi:tetratricopeptide (TPR) repeat protein